MHALQLCFLFLTSLACTCIALPVNSNAAAAIVEIEQTLIRFSHAVDTHDYSILDTVFAQNATANFNDANGLIQGRAAIENALNKGLEGTVSWHSLTTQRVDLSTSKTASAISYLQGVFFGQGNLTGEVFTSYGR